MSEAFHQWILGCKNSDTNCSICQQQFVITENMPRILPQCGHFFCSLCVAQMIRKGSLSCIVCEEEIQDVEAPENLPINQAVFQILKSELKEDNKDFSLNKISYSYYLPLRHLKACQNHKERKAAYFDTQRNSFLCQDCYERLSIQENSIYMMQDLSLLQFEKVLNLQCQQRLLRRIPDLDTQSQTSMRISFSASAEPQKQARVSTAQPATPFCFIKRLSFGAKFKVIQKDVGAIPSNRAAHSVCKIDENQVILFGGAFVGGSLAPENLHLGKLVDNKMEWKEVLTKGQRPGRRYGHTLCFTQPFLVLFGGSTGSLSLNETWILDLSQPTLQWSKLEVVELWPQERVYHSSDVCRFGVAQGMVIVYGGRDQSGQILSEIWGLRRHRNGRWDWTKPQEQGQTQGRYQHASKYIGPLLVNVGGKVTDQSYHPMISIYDYEQSKWFQAKSHEVLRHQIWSSGSDLFLQGGLDNQTKLFQNGKVVKVDLIELFAEFPSVVQKLKEQKSLKKETPMAVPFKPAEPQESFPKKKIKLQMGKQINNQIGSLAEKFINTLL